LLISGALLTGFGPGQAVAQDKIRIATKEFPPLVFTDGTGFCIDLARIFCTNNNLVPEFVFYTSVPELLMAVESGDCDMGFAGITITAEREQQVDFSQPFFDSGLAIAVKTKAISRFAHTGGALLRVFGISIILFVVGITLVAHVMWWVERDDTASSGFSTRYRKGILDAYWWAVVTMTTVGYGDKCPRKIIGRIVAGVWMIIGIIWFAAFTATLSSALTVDRIRHGAVQDLADLYNRRVAVIEGTTSDDFIRYHNVKLVQVKSFTDLIAKLKNDEVEAVVYDAPPLMYAAKIDPDIQVVGDFFAEQRYGVVFPNDRHEDLKEIIDIAILKNRRSGEFQKIYDKWF
jgi:polar amino acid transport system substrate-binding protein